MLVVRMGKLLADPRPYSGRVGVGNWGSHLGPGSSPLLRMGLLGPGEWPQVGIYGWAQGANKVLGSDTGSGEAELEPISKFVHHRNDPVTTHQPSHLPTLLLSFPSAPLHPLTLQLWEPIGMYAKPGAKWHAGIYLDSFPTSIVPPLLSRAGQWLTEWPRLAVRVQIPSSLLISHVTLGTSFSLSDSWFFISNLGIIVIRF